MKSNIAPAFTATGGSLTDGSSESISPKDLQAGVSVVICCYNSEQVLPETLKHFSNAHRLFESSMKQLQASARQDVEVP